MNGCPSGRPAWADRCARGRKAVALRMDRFPADRFRSSWGIRLALLETARVCERERPVLVASEVTTVSPAAVSLRVRMDQPVGTTGTAGSAPVTDASEAARPRTRNWLA